MSVQIEPVSRHLPASLPREVERMGYRILSALDRLGFVHQNRDGTVFTVRFSEAAVFGDELATYSIDLERLWHFRAGDLASPKVVEHLGMVLHKPVRVNTVNGLMYVVRLKTPQPTPRLPARVSLDLDARPASELAIPIGVGRSGPVWRDLPDVGHALIAGATGSGKSTWLHAALASLLTHNSPDRLQVALIDPKRSELAIWQSAPHVLAPLAYNVAGATQVLADLAGEVNGRGDLFARAGARDLATYNRRAARPLPVILAVIDEGLDLLLDAGDRSELVAHLKALTMRGRSAGVYVWFATQHASAASGLPRVVNVNLVTRLVFHVADGNAAQVAGCPGAQHIPLDRPGRMLAKVGKDPIELQGYWLADKDLVALAQLVSARRGSILTDAINSVVM